MLHYSCEIKILYFKFILRALPCIYTLYKMEITQKRLLNILLSCPRDTYAYVPAVPLCAKVMEKNLGPCFYTHSRKY